MVSVSQAADAAVDADGNAEYDERHSHSGKVVTNVEAKSADEGGQHESN